MAQESVELLERALAQTGRLVAGTRADQAGDATPCRSWEVERLVSHLVHDLDQFTVRASGRAPDWGVGFPDIDPEEWSPAFRAAADRLLAAWRAGGSGLDEERLRFTLGQQVSELAVHGWDLARGTGQPTEGLDDGIASVSLAWARLALQPQYRGSEEDAKAFGPEVAPPAGAGPQERLAAFFGRDPGWTP